MAIADRAVEVWGATLEDLFATSARALAELMADPATLGEPARHMVEAAADSPELLLFDFLSEILFLKDRDRVILAAAEVHLQGESPWRLAATLTGGTVDPERTRRGIDVKAVTLHELVVEKCAEGWHGQFVLDL
jgi:SHS2 domain-containing protein